MDVTRWDLAKVSFRWMKGFSLLAFHLTRRNLTKVSFFVRGKVFSLLAFHRLVVVNRIAAPSLTFNHTFRRCGDEVAYVLFAPF